MLDSICLGKRQAKLQIPAVWDHETSYNGRFYRVEMSGESTTVDLYQALERTHRDGLRDWPKFMRNSKLAVKITAFPSHLTSARVCLLAGKSGDDLVRVLFLPQLGKGPPKIKHLRVTLNQILAKMEEVVRAVESNLREHWPGFFDPSDEESSVSESEESRKVESEEVAMSADEDEGGDHESE